MVCPFWPIREEDGLAFKLFASFAATCSWSLILKASSYGIVCVCGQLGLKQCGIWEDPYQEI